MKKFAFITKKDEKSHAIQEQIQTSLLHANWELDKEHPQLVFSIGGDGTLLYGVHHYLDCLDDIMFVGIHTGTLGFFTDYTEDEVEQCIQDVLNHEPKSNTSQLLQIDVIGKQTTSIYALNEMRIENVIKTQTLDIYVDDEYFETCRGTGVCLSTQAGSTAYNRSLRGAVIDNGLSVLQLCEITGIQHTLYRSLGVPYILKDNRVVAFTSHEFDEALLCYDHLHIKLKDTNKVVCRLSDKKVHFARYRPYSYLKRLKNLY
ncbi:MAG: NAD kinase [Erysipelotrichaceae bacterium]